MIQSSASAPQATIAKKTMCWDFGSHFNIGTAFRA